MIAPDTEVEKYLSGKRIAVVFFNKDSRNLLRAYGAGLVAFPFSIEFVIDPTLAYRPRVRQLAESIFSTERIITDVAAIDGIVKVGAIDAVLIFEGGYEDNTTDVLFAPGASTVDSLEDFEKKCLEDYDLENVAKHPPASEFNARWSRQSVHFLARYFSTRGIYVVNAYNVPMPPKGTADKFILTFSQRHFLLANLHENLRHVPVRFVIGQDWACGKTTYLLEQMRQGASGLAGDFWFRLVTPDAIPSYQIQDIFAIKGVIVNLIRRASEARPGKPVFVKYDGRIEEFVFGIPRDRTYLIKDMHHFFCDCRFAIVHKADSPAMRDLVRRFADKYEVASTHIDRLIVHHDGRIEFLEPLPARNERRLGRPQARKRVSKTR
jgi:hypothetical protein